MIVRAFFAMRRMGSASSEVRSGRNSGKATSSSFFGINWHRARANATIFFYVTPGCLHTTVMAPLPSSLVGYCVSSEAIERYRALKNLPESNNRFLLQDLESRIGVPLALVRVERDDEAACDHYLCCFADYSGRVYDSKDLLTIPVPLAFHQLPQLIPVEGDLRRLFAPRTMIWSYDQSGKSRVNERALPIGDGHL